MAYTNKLRNEALDAYNFIMNTETKFRVPTDKRESMYNRILFCAITLSDCDNSNAHDLIANMNSKLLVPFTEEEQYQYGHNILNTEVF